MKKRSKQKIFIAAPQDDPGLIDLINKVRQQLSGVEQKLDILISQSSKRPFEKSYSPKPSPVFGQPRGHDMRTRGYGPGRERTFTRVICSDCKKECEIPFKPDGDRPVYCRECLSKRKQAGPFSANRDNRPRGREHPRERHFVKRHAGDHFGKRHAGDGPDKKKKPFYAGLKRHS